MPPTVYSHQRYKLAVGAQYLIMRISVSMYTYRQSPSAKPPGTPLMVASVFVLRNRIWPLPHGCSMRQAARTVQTTRSAGRQPRSRSETEFPDPITARLLGPASPENWALSTFRPKVLIQFDILAIIPINQGECARRQRRKHPQSHRVQTTL